MILFIVSFDICFFFSPNVSQTLESLAPLPAYV